MDTVVEDTAEPRNDVNGEQKEVQDEQTENQPKLRKRRQSQIVWPTLNPDFLVRPTFAPIPRVPRRNVRVDLDGLIYTNRNLGVRINHGFNPGNGQFNPNIRFTYRFP